MPKNIQNTYLSSEVNEFVCIYWDFPLLAVPPFKIWSTPPTHTPSILPLLFDSIRLKFWLGGWTFLYLATVPSSKVLNYYSSCFMKHTGSTIQNSPFYLALTLGAAYVLYLANSYMSKHQMGVTLLILSNKVQVKINFLCQK